MARMSDGKRDGSESGLMEKVLFVNRCSKTVKGGKKMSFSALILVGDGRGRVGFGFAKANELTDAIRKGGELAKKNMVTVSMEGTTIPHEVEVKWDGVNILMKPAKQGSGLIAGSILRSVLEFAGFQDVMAKNLGSNNPVNQIRAVFRAFELLMPRNTILESRSA